MNEYPIGSFSSKRYPLITFYPLDLIYFVENVFHNLSPEGIKSTMLDFCAPISTKLKESLITSKHALPL